MYPTADPRRAAEMRHRARVPLRLSLGFIGVLGIVSPLVLGLPVVAAGGAAVWLLILGMVRSLERGGWGFTRYVQALNVAALSLVAYAVFSAGVSPVITVYFPVLLLLVTAYLVGARQAATLAVLSLVLIVAAVVGPLPEQQPAGEIVTVAMRVGILTSVAIFVVIMRRSHDRQARELQRLARTDSLTGLANRSEFDRVIAEAIDRSARTGATGAVVFVDLDGMKRVNDEFGHPTGDALLVAIAERIAGVTRRVDTAARLGGDEFVIVLPEVDPEIGAHVYAEKLMEALSQPWHGRDVILSPSASVGVATFEGADESAVDLLRRADRAMYEAKRAGGRRIFSISH